MITSKQRAFLRSLANPIDTIIIIGKGGIGAQVINQTDTALTARELIKGRVLETAGITPKQAANELSDKLRCEVIQVIGTKFVLYRKNKDDPKIALPKVSR